MDSIGQPPSGGDRNLGPAIIALNCVLFTASSLIVIFRTFTRLLLTENFGWDDAVMVLTQVVNACGMGFVGAEVSNGLGRHKFYLPSGGYKKFLKYDYLDWAQVFATLALSKISICLFLLRLSSFRRVRLGFTGIICIVRTAFSGQVKSVDITWEGIPNALARILEINLGIIAACTPIMKPLVRYLRARATGQDPHAILYRTQTPMSHSHSHSAWYPRFRFGSRGVGSTSSKSILGNPFYNPTAQPPTGKDLAILQDLQLPIQGPRVETHIEAGMPKPHLESKPSLQSPFEVQDGV
ncbi:MAG: hypothetical protein Q9222_004454 [Ikaeria aurantiellina]